MAFVYTMVHKKAELQTVDQPITPRLSGESLEERSRALRLWHGEDYGFTNSEHFITIANTCFEDKVTGEPHP